METDYSRFIQVTAHGDEWQTRLVVDQQSFCIAQTTAAPTARWYATMLEKALRRLVAQCRHEMARDPAPPTALEAAND